MAGNQRPVGKSYSCSGGAQPSVRDIEPSSEYRRIKRHAATALVDSKGDGERVVWFWVTTGEQLFDHETARRCEKTLKRKEVGERGRNRTFNLLIKSSSVGRVFAYRITV
jgi:hypothetical protein